MKDLLEKLPKKISLSEQQKEEEKKKDLLAKLQHY